MRNNFLTALLQSRKFWVTLLGVIGSGILYFQGSISPEVFAQSITTLVGLLVGSIALEDAAAKHNR